MNARTALLDVFRDRRIARRRLEQLDRCFADGNEVRANPLRRDLLCNFDLQPECVTEEGERLGDVLNGDADVIEDGFGRSGGSARPVFAAPRGTRPTYEFDDF